MEVALLTLSYSVDSEKHDTRLMLYDKYDTLLYMTGAGGKWKNSDSSRCEGKVKCLVKSCFIYLIS